MTRQWKLVLTSMAVLTALVFGWYELSGSAKPLHAAKVDAELADGSGILDGLVFSGELGLLGKPADVKDKLVFADGMFVSTECEKRCNYPARPYFVRQRGEKIEFVSETQCPTKDAKIVWRGTVDNETISGEATWTVNRWYWTVEKKFWFEGTLAEPATSTASK